MPRRAKTPSLFVLALMAMCVGLVAIELGLVRQNRELAAQVAELRQAAETTERAALRSLEGRPFPVLELLDERGDALGLTDIPESHATLLFISTPSCDFCQLAGPVWDSLYRRLRGTRIRAFGLLLDAESATTEAPATSYPRLSAGDRGAGLLRALPGVPVAVLLDSSGTVQHAIYGGNQVGLEDAVNDFLAHGETVTTQ